MPPSLTPPPHGLYLYGDVGTGKSMLMDLFYSTVPPHLSRRRRRVHFHAFMVDVHKRIHKVREEGSAGGVQDPILYVARDLANEACILCFDEFQVFFMPPLHGLANISEGHRHCRRHDSKASL